MSYLCHHAPPAPQNKQFYIQTVGQELIKRHGKRKFYSPKQVRSASQDRYSAIDWHCWAMVIFCSLPDFKTYHEFTGEVCDYTSMKVEMLSGLGVGISLEEVTESMADLTKSEVRILDLSWLEWPDLGFLNVFDIFS